MANSRKVGKWTVMIYLAGDNNLSSEMIYSIKEMKRVKGIGPDGPVTVLVLFDPPPGLPAQAYVINHGDKDNQLIHEANLVATIKVNRGNGVVKTLVINPPSKSNTEDINTGDPRRHNHTNSINTLTWLIFAID